MACGVLVSVASFIGATIALAVIFTQTVSQDASTILSATSVVLMITIIVGLLLVVAYSDDGFQVSGSTLEWMIAAMLSPGAALFLFFFANPDRDGSHVDYIDITDEKRMSNL